MTFSSEAYERGVARALADIEKGRLELEAQAAEEAAQNEGKVPYEQKMAAMRHNLRVERLKREAERGFKDGIPLSWRND